MSLSTAITATTPAHDVGAAPVVVTEADGTLVTVGGFFFTPATTATTMTVISVNPLMGSTAGHIPVAITGSGFRDGAQVAFGGAVATEVRVLADAIIIAVTPPHDAGPITVVVTDGSGQSGSLDSAFTYVTPPPAPAPTITSLEPASAPASGLSPTSTALDDHHGQPVAIIGTGFQPDAAVTFGGTPVDHATTVSGMVILTTAPDHAVGMVDVVVTNPDGQSATSPIQFAYTAPTPGPAPTIATVAPAPGSGDDHGAAPVTITGTKFHKLPIGRGSDLRPCARDECRCQCGRRLNYRHDTGAPGGRRGDARHRRRGQHRLAEHERGWRAVLISLSSTRTGRAARSLTPSSSPAASRHRRPPPRCRSPQSSRKLAWRRAGCLSWFAGPASRRG